MKPTQKTVLIQVALFLLTLVTTALAGAEWMQGKSFLEATHQMGLKQFFDGFQFAVPFLFFLSVHEFGHYFTAKKWKINVSLPYYIPLWLGIFTSIGTMGAFIRIKEKIKSRVIYFDIGISGPLAGFIASLAVLAYGFTHLPSLDYLFSIHPEYKIFGADYAKYVYNTADGTMAVRLGDNLLFSFFKNYVADPTLLPHPNEITHYPLLFAGYLGLFFTALNLIPIGQLDGGHILYALIGKRAFDIVSPILFFIFVFYAGLGLFTYEEFQLTSTEDFPELLLKFVFYIYFIYLCFSRVSTQPINNVLLALVVVVGQVAMAHFLPDIKGYDGFLAFSFLLGRVLGIYHPPVEDERPLSLGRKLLGWFIMLVFLLCFSPTPLYYSI